MTRAVLITGGTGSLGRETARALAAAGWFVVLTGRDAAQAAKLGASLGGLGLPLDLSSLADVGRFADDLLSRGLPLHAVVCNAGSQFVSGTKVTGDGFEATFAVNHLAHFLLVRRLLPGMAAPGRIVLVTSDTHDPRRPTGMPAPVYTDARALAFPVSPNGASAAVTGRRRYTTSKLCNVLMAYELARRLDGGPTVNAFDPGLMPGTGLARDYSRMQALAWKYVLPVLAAVPGLNVHTPRRSGAALARLVTDPALADVTGRYFSGTQAVESSVDSYDPAKAADLWQTSVKLTAYFGGGAYSM